MERKRKKRIAIYPGTFDPVTNGHIDVLQRTLKIFDEVIVAVAPSKSKGALFTIQERIVLIENATRNLARARTEAFEKLLVDYAIETNSIAIVRGLRAISDFEYEMQMALMNRRLDATIETVFMMPSEEHTFISSTLVKEVASFGGPVKGLVPQAVAKALKDKFQK